MAVTLRARTRHALDLDDTLRRQLFLPGKMRQAGGEATAPLDVPWRRFDVAEIALYSGDRDEFLDWTPKGLARCEHRWEPETFRSALQLLTDGGGALDGLGKALPLVDEVIAKLP